MIGSESEKKKRQTSRTIKTASGDVEFPLIGLGTWKSQAGEVQQAVLDALEIGYRHIDCAAIYGNEKEVGQALKQAFEKGIVKREEVFITSKLWNNAHHPDDVIPNLKQTLADLGLTKLDLYLVHWPIAFIRGPEKLPRNEDGTMKLSELHYLETWKAMENAVEQGLVTAIGLSNFNSRQIKEILDASKIKPAVLQVESHPYLTQEDLIAFCEQNSIVVTASSPLGSPDRPWAQKGDPSLLEDPQLLEIAAKHEKTPAQTLIRFQTQRGVAVIPKSVTKHRIEENFTTFDFDLDDEDFAKIRSFNRNWRACIPSITKDGEVIPRDIKSPFFPFGESDRF